MVQAVAFRKLPVHKLKLEFYEDVNAFYKLVSRNYGYYNMAWTHPFKAQSLPQKDLFYVKEKADSAQAKTPH